MQLIKAIAFYRRAVEEQIVPSIRTVWSDETEPSVIPNGLNRSQRHAL
jgi:hypothetical protein